MQQSPSLRRSKAAHNLREKAPPRPPVTPEELRKRISDFLDGRNPHDVVEHETPESLLPLLSSIILLRSGDEQIAQLPLLRQFFDFTKQCRKSVGPRRIIASLPRHTAIWYTTLLTTFSNIIEKEDTSLNILRFIFAEELGIEEESDETKKMVVMVMADLPFNVENWVNLWIALIQAIWGGIWQATLFVRRLRDGMVLGKGADWMPARAREMQWAQWQIARQAGMADNILEEREDAMLRQREIVSKTTPNPETPAIETPTQPGKVLNRKENSETTPSKLPTQPPQKGIGERRVPERERRPRAIYLPRTSPELKPAPSKIDQIVGQYAKLPRLKWDKEGEWKKELARQKKSEEEFNFKLRERYREIREKENLIKMAARGAVHGEIDEAEKILRAGAVDELSALHRRILEQDKELEDTTFEKWAGELLAEGEEEEYDDD
ncbi:hypothetical protein TWF481_005013 [Arthrobotrys musiformis]|uniref:Uncharacterized protein n=1 Tax=Arthrobotrys musiformis TaxID=47236 RepID=A0AAV9WL86_9PEZI